MVPILELVHNGGPVYNYSVASTGTKVYTPDAADKGVILCNSSDTAMFLALKSAPSSIGACAAVGFPTGDVPVSNAGEEYTGTTTVTYTIEITEGGEIGVLPVRFSVVTVPPYDTGPTPDPIINATGTFAIGNYGVKATFTHAAGDVYTVGDQYAIVATAAGTVCQAVVNKGIYLTAAGGRFEMNTTNFGSCEIWAIHAAAGVGKNLAVQVCQ